MYVGIEQRNPGLRIDLYPTKIDLRLRNKLTYLYVIVLITILCT